MTEHTREFSSDEDIKATIIALEKQALELWNNGNPNGFIELSTDDIVYFDPAFENKLEGKKDRRNIFLTHKKSSPVYKERLLALRRTTIIRTFVPVWL